MKHTTLLAILIASLITNLFLLLKSNISLPFTKSSNTTKIVIKVIDGDTFDTKDGLRIRLASIDAPEYPKNCYSLQSKNRLEYLIIGKEIVMEDVGKDNFGRTVAFVFSNDLLINKSMVSEGYASVSDKDDSKYSHDLTVAQDESQKAKRGIWSEACQTQKNANCVIKGNYRTDNKTRLYHTPDCYNYDKISVNLDEKDQWFCTEDEARNAGFTKSSDCP